MNEWRAGVAFVRGINMYGNLRITKEEMIAACKQIENECIRILGSVKADNILFEKRGIHYAAVGSKLEKVLTSHFGRKIFVTVRSAGTLAMLLHALPGR